MIHPNTWQSYQRCKSDSGYSRIVWQIAAFFEARRAESFTDREVLKELYGSQDMNLVRPKITKLIQDGFLSEVGDVFDDTTDRHVRKVKWDPQAIGVIAHEKQKEFSL